jgi:LuxR family maltose regulon positive regulatory protein
MPFSVLATKLFMPPPRPNAVLRPRLIERLNEDQGRGRALTLVSAPAGFGKSTLLSAWIDQRVRQDQKLRVAWLSLDEGDSDPSRFLLYLAAALHGVEPSCGADAMAAVHSPQPPSAESILTDLINEIDGIAGDILVVLGDYHAVHSPQVDDEITFLVEHLPARMRLVIATREDPILPLARLRARGELTELRAADLRFSPDEAADFLGRVMGLELTAEEIAALESRTEGWIAGLQLAALSMQRQKDIAGFIHSFTGSHRFVLDYLAEEVLRYQPEGIQAFLLRTSILDRFCGPLCDALMQGDLGPRPDLAASGQETLEYLERSNLFIVPLDGERRWYRYHRLFAELLRQRLEQSAPFDSSATIRSRTRPRHISAWPVYTTNGTIWMPRRSVGNEASSSHGSTTALSTGSSFASSSWPVSRSLGDVPPQLPPGSTSSRPPRGRGISSIAFRRSPRCRYPSSCARATWRQPLISPRLSICPRAGHGSSWRGTNLLRPWRCSCRCAA